MALRNGKLFALQHLNFEPLLLFYATAVTLNRMLQYRLYSMKFCTLPSLLPETKIATNMFHGNNCWHLFDSFNGTMQRLDHELNVERLYLIQNMSLFPVLLIISSVTAFLADISPFVSYEILLVALIIKIVHAFGLLVVSIDQVVRVVNLNVTSWSLSLFENLSGGNVLLYTLIFASICENTRKLDRYFFVSRAFLLHAFGLFIGELLAALLDYVARNSRNNFFLWYGLSYLLAVSVVFVYAFKISYMFLPGTEISERVMNDTIAAPEGTSYVQFSDEQQIRGNADERAHGKWPVCLNVLIFAILLVTFVIVNDDFGFLNESSYTAYHVSLFFDNWTVVQYPIIRIVQAGFRVIGLLITCLYFSQRRNSFTNGTVVALFAIVLQFVHYSLFYRFEKRVFVWNNVILSMLFDMFHFVPSVVFMSVFSKEYALNNNKLFCLIFIIERLFHLSWRYVLFGASYHDLVTLQTNNTFILKSLGILSVLLLLTPLVIFYYCRETHNLSVVRLTGFSHCNGRVHLELKQVNDQRGQEEQPAREKRQVQKERQVQLVRARQLDRQTDRQMHQGDERSQQNTADGNSNGHGGRIINEFDHVYRTRGPLRKTFDRFKRSRVAFRKRDPDCVGRASAMCDKPGDSSGFVRPPPAPSSSADRNVRLLSVKSVNDDNVNRGPPPLPPSSSSVVPTNTMNRVHNRHDRCDPLQQVYMCTEV